MPVDPIILAVKFAVLFLVGTLAAVYLFIFGEFIKLSILAWMLGVSVRIGRSRLPRWVLVSWCNISIAYCKLCGGKDAR